MIDDAVLQMIWDHPSTSPSHIKADVKEEHGVDLAPTTILKILNDRRRTSNLASSQLKASERLSEKVDLIEQLVQSYLDFMQDSTIKASERLTAMRDLRGWVKLAIESAGESGNLEANLFEIGEDWNLGFEPKQVN